MSMYTKKLCTNPYIYWLCQIFQVKWRKKCPSCFQDKIYNEECLLSHLWGKEHHELMAPNLFLNSMREAPDLRSCNKYCFKRIPCHTLSHLIYVSHPRWHSFSSLNALPSSFLFRDFAHVVPFCQLINWYFSSKLQGKCSLLRETLTGTSIKWAPPSIVFHNLGCSSFVVLKNGCNCIFICVII